MQPGGFDLSRIVMQAQQMQADLERAQTDLAHAAVTGTAGGGLVTATVNGSGELQSLDIDKSVVDPDDIETLADLIVAAVRDASRAAKEVSDQTMGAIAGGLGAGLDFSSLGLGDIPGLSGLAGLGGVVDAGDDAAER